MWLVIHIPWKMNQRVAQAAYKLRDVCRDLVHEKKQTLEQGKGSENAPNVDIISVLLQKEELDDDGLVNQMLTFLAAGITACMPDIDYLLILKTRT